MGDYGSKIYFMRCLKCGRHWSAYTPCGHCDARLDWARRQACPTCGEKNPDLFTESALMPEVPVRVTGSAGAGCTSIGWMTALRDYENYIHAEAEGARLAL